MALASLEQLPVQVHCLLSQQKLHIFPHFSFAPTITEFKIILQTFTLVVPWAMPCRCPAEQKKNYAVTLFLRLHRCSCLDSDHFLDVSIISEPCTEEMSLKTAS